MSIKTVQTKIEAIRELMAEVQIQISSARDSFTEAIKDKSIPLADRWDLFSAAPEGFRGHHTWIWHPEALRSLGRREWDALTYPERYQDIDVTDLVNDRIDLRNPENDDLDNDEVGEGVTREIMIALMEEMLEKNIGSFTFDW